MSTDLRKIVFILTNVMGLVCVALHTPATRIIPVYWVLNVVYALQSGLTFLKSNSIALPFFMYDCVLLFEQAVYPKVWLLWQ